MISNKVSQDQEYCYLKTPNHQFKQFNIELEDKIIYFLRWDETEGAFNITHKQNINDVHVQIGRTEKFRYTKILYFCLLLALKNDKKQACYFDSDELRTKWHTKILNAQGYKDYLEQY